MIVVVTVNQRDSGDCGGHSESEGQWCQRQW